MSMNKWRVIIIGYGVQGKKRKAIAKQDCVAIVDSIQKEADYRSVYDVPLHSFDVALVCTPDEVKEEILEYLLSHQKHVLVEKPLIGNNLQRIKQISEENRVVCYTAYNHRFEPHFIRMKQYIDSGCLGKIYTCRLFYGNGTARDVKNSVWRDKNLGVLTDLGSHLLDTLLFWFPEEEFDFRVNTRYCFENRSFDYVNIESKKGLFFNLEMTLLSWKNHFTCDILAEKGSAHIESLCKWGPAKFTTRIRKYPSGIPEEETLILTQPDPTWEKEYRHFLNLCFNKNSNMKNDMKLKDIFNQLENSLCLESNIY